jgi:hypothetical protein
VGQIEDTPQKITSVIEGVHKEKVKQAKDKCKEEIERCTQYKTAVINGLRLNGIL